MLNSTDVYCHVATAMNANNPYSDTTLETAREFLTPNRFRTISKPAPATCMVNIRL
jgi:hypothetical protein